MIDDIIHKHPEWPNTLYIACKVDYFYGTDKETYTVEQVVYSYICDSYINWRGEMFKGTWNRRKHYIASTESSKDRIVLKKIGEQAWRIEGSGVFRTEKEAYKEILKWFRSDQREIQKRIDSILEEFPETTGKEKENDMD